MSKDENEMSGVSLKPNMRWFDCYHSIARLIDALRSGRYPQGNGGRLRQEGDLFSVGGVACDVYLGATRIGRWAKYKKYDYWLFEVGRDRGAGLPPEAVMDWYGFEAIQPRTSLAYMEFMAASGRTFAEIGNYLAEIYFPAAAAGEEGEYDE